MNDYFGCEVVYKNGRCTKIIDLCENIDAIGIEGPNKVYVFCSNCQCYMKYDIDNDAWHCEQCGKKVRGSTPYHYIEKKSRESFDDYGVYD